MKIFLTNIAFLITSSFMTGAIAQNVNREFYKEQINLFTDRTIYIVGEEIQFSANLCPVQSNSFDYLSNILYLELVTPDGKSVTGEKYKLTNLFCSGSITIPGDILTGFYYLKAYTKAMRNSGPNKYYYGLLKIINPYKNELIDYNAVENSNEQILGDNNNDFKITSNKKRYANRDSVNIKISSRLQNNSFKKLTLSVVPVFSYFNANIPAKITNSTVSTEIYYPETRGISVTGSVVDEKTGVGIPYAVVNLSIIGENKDFMATECDSLGYFFFALPDFLGSKKIFLSSRKTATISPKILVFNDFCPKNITIKTSKFELSEAEKETAYKLAVNTQLKTLFAKDSLDLPIPSRIYKDPFYGDPSQVLYLDDYIELPTLEDCFIELPFHVTLVKNKNEKSLKIWGPQSGLSAFSPLVLVDMVAITDYKKILSISPKTISHIEIVTIPYIKGNMTYGGIISIFSKDGDYGGINLPETGIFIDYKFLSDNIRKNNTVSINKPDTRNTLAWFPDLKPGQNNSVSVSFKTSDTNGKYLILVRGFTDKGEIMTTTDYFDVE